MGLKLKKPTLVKLAIILAIASVVYLVYRSKRRSSYSSMTADSFANWTPSVMMSGAPSVVTSGAQIDALGGYYDFGSNGDEGLVPVAPVVTHGPMTQQVYVPTDGPVVPIATQGPKVFMSSVPHVEKYAGMPLIESTMDDDEANAMFSP